MRFRIWISIAFSYVVISTAQLNLSQNGTTKQSSTYTHEGRYLGSSLAVTGGPTNDFGTFSCATTDRYQYTAWWMLSFMVGTVFIETVKIFYRSSSVTRFAFYALYVSNTTVSTVAKPTGHLCYQHDGTTSPSLTELVKCFAMGRNIIIFNHRNSTQSYPSDIDSYAWLELCDVQVLGCYKGWFGANCTLQCPVHCISRHCYPGNGSCIWGCQHQNCLNDKCADYTCVDGCKAGFRRTICDQACESGKFGFDCLETCHCFNQSCDHVTGICPYGGCQPGYEGSRCDIETKESSDVVIIGVGVGVGCGIIAIIIIYCIIKKCRRQAPKRQPNEEINLAAEHNLTAEDIDPVAKDINQAAEVINTAAEIINPAAEHTQPAAEDNNSAANIDDDGDGYIEPPNGTEDSRSQERVEEMRCSITYPPESMNYPARQMNEHSHGSYNTSENIISGESDYVSMEPYTSIHLSDFQGKVNEMRCSNTFQNEFMNYKAGLLKEHVCGSSNTKKNRYEHIIPYDHSRVRLQGNRDSDYINASYVKNCNDKVTYIAAQGPMQETVGDFLQMVWQENVLFIVMLSKLREDEREHCAVYWPKMPYSKNIEEFTVSVINRDEQPMYIYRKIRISLQNTQRIIHQIQILDWRENSSVGKEKLVNFFKQFKVIQESCDRRGLVVVHCNNGCGRTGCFIALDALYEYGKVNQSVDVPSYIEQMRHDRLNMIESTEQYQDLYEALAELLPDPIYGCTENLKSDEETG